jgi:molybdopterin-guanine dinucleotide biosynthesis protein MobB
MASLDHVFGIVGWKDSGKTSLLVDLVQALRRKSLSVSTIKHAHHDFDIDKPGKDSFLHREAGAAEVMIASGHRWALMAGYQGFDRPTLHELVERMSTVDVILAEGFKSDPHPKLEVHRSCDVPLIALQDKSILVVVTPDPAQVADCPCPVIARTNIDAIVDLILETVKVDERASSKSRPRG